MSPKTLFYLLRPLYYEGVNAFVTHAISKGTVSHSVHPRAATSSHIWIRRVLHTPPSWYLLKREQEALRGQLGEYMVLASLLQAVYIHLTFLFIYLYLYIYIYTYTSIYIV